MVSMIDSYAFLHARLGALRSTLLGPEAWKGLLAVSDFEERRQVLRDSGYGPWLGASPVETIAALRQPLYDLTRRVERSVAPAAASFTRAWARRDLLRNLKAILRGKALGLPEDRVRSELIELDPRFRLPVEALLGAADVSSALDILESGPMRHWIRTARRVYEKDPSLFGLDAALDRLYYSDLWRMMKRLGDADRASVEALIELEVDQVNLLWLLRYRLNYRLSPGETFYLLLLVTGEIDPEQLKEMVRQDTIADVARQARVPWARRLLEGCDTLWQVEVALWRRRVEKARWIFRTGAFTLGEALALLVLKIAELRDLVTVLQGGELGVPGRQIEAQLVSFGPEGS